MIHLLREVFHYLGVGALMILVNAVLFGRWWREALEYIGPVFMLAAWVLFTDVMINTESRPLGIVTAALAVWYTHDWWDDPDDEDDDDDDPDDEDDDGPEEWDDDSEETDPDPGRGHLRLLPTVA
jgi:hypothetical protein